MLTFLQLVHELVKFAGLLLLAQGLVYALSFGRHEVNPVYKGLRFLTSPMTGVMRRITPRFVLDKHIPIAAFLLLFWVWLALIFVRLALIKGVV